MNEDVQLELNHAKAAVEHAQEVREYHRRRTRKGNVQRENDLSLALDRLKRAMQPLRTRIGKMPYVPLTVMDDSTRDSIRAASKTIQVERRKLWKMRKDT